MNFRNESGQSFVELALVMVFLLVLFSVIVDGGWMLFQMISLRAAAQEGATVASVCPGDSSIVEGRVRDSSSDPGDLSSSTVTVCIVNPSTDECTGTIAVGTNVRVSVTYTQKIINPLAGSIIGAQEFPITVEATSTILRTTCVFSGS